MRNNAKKQFLSILFLFSFSFIAICDPIGTFRLDHLSIGDGLPHSSVSNILQDSNGFMWIGTQSGLSRYDGYKFKTYLNDPFDSNSLPHNLVQTMYLDKNDILWLGTYNGLSRMEINSDTFINYTSKETDEYSLSNDVVVAIERDHRGRLWVGTLDGLNLFDEKTGLFKRFVNNPDDRYSLPNNTVRSLLSDKNGNLWIGTYGGLSLWDEESGSFINFKPEEGNPQSIPSVYVMDMEQDPLSENEILLGFWGGGVARFNTMSEKAVRYEIPDMRVYTLLVDDQQRIWAGTWGGGLSILSSKDGTYTHFKQGATSDLTHNIIYSLFQDSSGVLWIGTNGGGINKYVDWKNQYKFYTNDPEDPFSIPSGKVVAAYEDSQSRLWFGLQGSGLSRLDPGEKSFKNYYYDENDDTSISNSNINAVYEDHNGNLWIGTNNGLNRYIDETDSFEQFYAGEEGASLPENLIYAIVEDNDNNLWLGSYTRGISLFNIKTGEITYYRNDKNDPASLSDNLIRSLYVDSQGLIWVCTNKGLNLFEPDTKSFRRFLHNIDDRKSISSNDVRCVFEDSEGKLWIATNGGGINLFNRESQSFSHLSTRDGLLSNSVIGIEEDNTGNLVFLTQAGLSLFNKKDKVFTAINEKTGLLGSELTSGYVHADDGSFYIGANNGITRIPYFKETLIDFTPTIHINGFSVLGIPYENSHIPIWKKEEILLKYNENTISFDFSLNDYSSAGLNQFAYMLEGVDSDWVYSGVRNFARYTQLKPGEYTFRVTGADSRNNWNHAGTSLKIKIQRPFWKSIFAYVLYFLLIVLFLLAFILRYKKRELQSIKKIEEQQSINMELENRVKKRTAQIEEARKIAENATKAKSLFLANMSHELRTPLNAVIGFSALLNEDDFNSEKKHIIRSIKNAGKGLSTLINDLLDLSKMEAGKMSIKIAPVHISTVLFEIRHIFELRVNEKKLSFHIEIDPDLPDELLLDETRFRQILINLTGNAIKFTHSGFIRIKIEKLDNKKHQSLDLKLTIEDSGSGISNAEKAKIFEIFWQSEDDQKNKPSGTGLGLSITKNLVKLMNGEISVESEINRGTTFTVYFFDVTTPVSVRSHPKSANSDIREKLRFKNIKALIVDDIEDNRNLLIEIMKKVKIGVIAAENGREAIALAERDNPDIIFMDIQMPVLDGISASKRIKENSETRAIPIVAVTASAETDFYSRNADSISNFSGHISKPYSFMSIIDVLNNLLSSSSYTLDEDALSIQSDFNNDDITDREALLAELAGLYSDWKELRPTGRMSILENFGKRLQEIGNRYNARILISYSDDLLTYIQLFDLSGIEIELTRYPEIIEMLKS